ncbi:MAG: PAS domain S-box protein [Chloroflexi bacterium]|nr:PAS domain S-box protein [Chloroflexota bacterium]
MSDEFLLSTILELAPNAIIVVDDEQRIILFNRSAGHSFGYSAEEVFGKPLDILLPPTAIDAHRQQVNHFMQSRRASRRMEERENKEVFEGRRKDGTIFPIEVSIGVIPYKEGRIGVAIINDITERKERQEKQRQLQERIRAQELQLSEIMDAMPAGILVVDDRGCVVMANPVAEKFLRALAGNGVGDVITHLGDRPLDELLTSPSRDRWHEVKLNDRIFEVVARPLYRDAKAEHWVLVIDEVTEQRAVQAQLHQQERLAAVGQLASGIAHDFNNIMSVIVLYAQLAARRKSIPEPEREWIEIMNQQAWHAIRLIQQILDFSRQAVLDVQPLNLIPLLKEQIKMLQRTLPSSIEIEITYDGEEEYRVEADPTRMQQLLTNLAINARDAMPEGGFLRISIERIAYGPKKSPRGPELETGEWIKLTVSDTGTGIAPEVMEHLFEPFFTTKAPGKGTGLGLAQVYGIVNQHEGHIDVDSEVGKGTTFTIYLPALQTQVEAPPSLKESSEMWGHGERILLVEDDAAVRMAMVQLLKHLNYRVLEAADGEEALAILEKTGAQIDLVMSDVVMPRLGGIPLLYALRELGWQMPVILLTGYPEEEQLKIAQSQGLSAYLSKPPDPDELAQALAEALHGGAA